MSRLGLAAARRAVARARPWTLATLLPILVGVEEPELGCRPGDHILVDLLDDQTVRCSVVNAKDDGTIQGVPEHAVVVH